MQNFKEWDINTELGVKTFLFEGSVFA